MLKDWEAILIVDVVRRHDGNRAAAAKELEINPSTLYRKTKSLNIELPKAVPAATRVTNAGRNYRLCYPSRVAQPPKKSINDAGAF